MGQDKLNKDSVVAASNDQVACDMAGETAILNLKSGLYYGLNAMGTRIWNLIQDQKSVTEVLNTLLSEYDVESESCERDLLALLEQLEAKGLVKVKNATPE